MSLIFIDGFDHYGFIRAKWEAAGAFDNPTFEAGRFGGQAIKKQFQNAQQSIRRSFAQEGEVFFGCALKTPAFSSITESYFRLEDTGGTTICSVNVTPAGNIAIQAGGFVSTSTSTLNTTQWHYIEVHYIPKDAAGKGGIAELRVNEAVVALIDGALFRTTTTTDDDIAAMGIMDDGTNSPRYLMDDLYILSGSGTSNNSYLGDVRITALYPTADGTDNDWTGSDTLKDNFDHTNETLMNSGTDYVESGLVGAAEDYNNESFSERSLAPGQIFGVQVANATLRTATGAINYKHTMTVAGIDFSDDVEYNPGTGAYFIETYIRDTDPSDDATWTEDKVAAVGSGIVITSKVTI